MTRNVALVYFLIKTITFEQIESICCFKGKKAIMRVYMFISG